jgi:hypothetical protein
MPYVHAMRRLTLAFLLAAAPLLLAQQQPDNDPLWEAWIRANGQLYENFFQDPGSGGETVTAMQGEVGASLRVAKGVRAYGSANYLHFFDDTLEGSPGVRVGARGDLRPHGFDVYAEVLKNRPSFELDEFSGADIRRLAGEYSYRFLDDWQASVDGDFEQQEFDNSQRDNDFHQAGAAIRWRGSRVFSPQIGFRTGERDVNDPLQSYDQHEWYLQIRSQTTERLYLSARFRDRKRDYQNIAREDKRRQINVSADYTISDTWVVNLYGAREHVDTTQTGRDFTSGYWMAGLTYKF